MPTEIQEFPEIEEFPESEGQAPKPVVAPTGTIGPSTLSPAQKLRISPVGRFLLGPTEIERQGMVGETPAEQRGVLELGETLLGATAPGATPWVQKPAMALARAMTPIAQALPAVVKAVGGGLAAQKLAAIPSGAAQGVAGAALGFPLAPIPGLKTKAGVAALAAFGTEYLASQPEQLAAFKAALDRGDYGEATKIAVGDVATGAALGLGVREARRAQLESRVAQAEGKPPPIPVKPSVSETTPPVPAAEMPKTPTATGLRPAIRLVGGKVVAGDAGVTHPDIIKANGLKAEEIDQRGFVDEQGKFLDREQAAAASGVPTEREPGRQHSTDLPEAKPAAEPPPPVTEVAPTKQLTAGAAARVVVSKPLYHGSFKSDLTSLKPSKAGDFGGGIYLSDDPKFSQSFAESTAFDLSPEERAARGSGKVYEVELTGPLKKVFTADDSPLSEAEIAWWRASESGLDEGTETRAALADEKSGHNFGPWEKSDHEFNSKDWDAFLSKFGYDAVRVGSELVVRDPKLVKIKTKPVAPAGPAEGVVPAAPSQTATEPVSQPKGKGKSFDFGAAGREAKANYESAISAAGDADAVEMRSPKYPNLRVIITKDPSETGKWRATRVDEKGPSGHSVYNSKEEAISDYTGGHKTAGPSWGWDFRVVKTSKPDKVSPVAEAQDLSTGESTLEAGGKNPPAATASDIYSQTVRGAAQSTKITSADIEILNKLEAAKPQQGQIFPKLEDLGVDKKTIRDLIKRKLVEPYGNGHILTISGRFAKDIEKVSKPTPAPVAQAAAEVQRVAKTKPSLESQRQAIMAKVESNQKLTPAERKIFEGMKGEAKPEEKPQVEAGLGPEQSMGGALYGFKGPAEIEQLTDALKGVQGQKPPLGQRIKDAFGVGERLAGVKTAVGKAVSGLKATGDYIKRKFEGVNTVDELLREKGVLSAELEKRGWRVREWEKQAKTSVPSARDQAAIAKWVDAGGDRAELQRGLAETKPEFKQAYQDALNLKGDLLAAAENVRNYFEARLQEAVDAGVVKDGVEDYIHRMYEAKPALQKAALAHVQTGLLSTRPSLAKKRVFQFDWESEKLGYRPVQSFIPRIAEYESSLSRAIAARAFIKKATTMKAPDGRPVIDVKGVGIPIEDPTTGAREATLIKPQFNPARANEPGTPNYRGDYVNKEFPALSKWKWVSEDAGGKPIFVQGDVAIHPDFVHRISALLEPSRVRFGRYGAVLRPALGVSSAFKQTMLDLSGFHQVQIAVHGLEHKVNPFNLVQTIDFENPNVDGLLKGGMTLGGDYRYSKEGLVGASLTRQIPGLGPVMESYHQWLFQDFIPRVKTTMALKALERNRARYPNLSQEQIFNKTAMQANSAFGELNYIMLERSATARDIARIIFLAPDFLEARGRFAAEALSKGGKRFSNEQRTALFLGAITMYITARIGNKLLDDQYHFEPENAFSLVHNGEAYSLRTVQGDILHMLEKPLQFWMHRLNPVFGRTALEMATQRDEFGRRRTIPQVLWDTVSNIMPIALRTSRERSIWESIANSLGITERRWQDTDSAYKLAKNWKDKRGIGERGEFIYDPEKDPLRGLKIALSRSDEAGAAAEIRKILLSKVYTTAKLDAYFSRYAESPFTGSRENDRKWFASLSEDEKKTVTAARQHKKEIGKLYRKALSKYYATRTNQ